MKLDVTVMPQTTDEGHLFTPYESNNTYDRIEMRLNDDDINRIGRGRGWSAVVTDQLTGKTFEVGADTCGIATCYCAAKILREI